MSKPKIKHTSETAWKHMGLKNRLTLLALIDDLIKKDESFRKGKSREQEKAKREAKDQKLKEEQNRRLFKEHQKYTSSLSLRQQEFDKKKQENIKAASTRLKKIQTEERERAIALAERVQKVKLQTHKQHKKDRTEAIERERQIMESVIAKLNSKTRQIKIQEERNKAEQDALKKRLDDLDRQKIKTRVAEEKTVNQKQKEKLAKSVRQFKALEHRYEQEALSFIERINGLEKEKMRQKEKLRKRNDEFKQVLEKRKKLSDAQRQSKEKWNEEYIAKLKERISDIEKRKEKATLEFCDNITISEDKSKKGLDSISRKRQQIQVENKHRDENMRKRINKMERQKEKETDTVIKAIRKFQKRKENLETVYESESDSEIEDIRGFSSREQTRIKWETEAKEREDQRVKEAFRKLMGNLGTNA